MRTELARVQTEAQKQSFERNGFDKYIFIVNHNASKHGCCSHCEDVAKRKGRYSEAGVYLVKDMMPGENAPPMHPHCRCSTAAWEDDAEYEAWLDYLEQGGTTAEWNETGKKEWAKANKALENSENGATIKSKWDNDLPPRGQVTEKISEDDLYSWVANEIGVSEQEATEYVDSVLNFTDATSGIYSEIRRYQRGNPLEFLTEEEAKKFADSIETYIQKAPRWNGGTTFRGVSVSDDELASYIQGQEITAGGSCSWSGKKAIARDIALRNTTSERPNPVIYHCATQSKGTGIRHISVYENEDEVLCSTESKWKVVRTEVDSEFITHVYVEEVL